MRYWDSHAAYIAERICKLCGWEIRTLEGKVLTCYAYVLRKEVSRVRIGDIDIYHLPAWLEAIFEEVERTCYEKLEEESEFYRNILSEVHELLDKHKFLSTIADSDEIEEPLNLNLEETKALSRFWLLETDRMSMERVQMYLLGCRHMWETMELLDLRK